MLNVKMHDEILHQRDFGSHIHLGCFSPLKSPELTVIDVRQCAICIASHLHIRKKNK